MVSDHKLDDEKYECSSALGGKRNVFFCYGRFAIHRTSLYSIRFSASVSYMTKTRMIHCSLNRKSFCMNYAIFWTKLEVMVITLEPRTSNIAGSSCKKYQWLFHLFLYKEYSFITTGHVSSRSNCILNFYWRPIHFSHTILSLLTTQCTSAPCMTNADCSV